jgi:L-threonylcarbamoyladenylate synthase
MLDSHYAPVCEIELVESPLLARNRAAKLHAGLRSVLVLDYCSDLDAYAKHLYEFLRRADRDGFEVVVAVMPPAIGLGHAIRDRLYKASVRY